MSKNGIAVLLCKFICKNRYLPSGMSYQKWLFATIFGNCVPNFPLILPNNVSYTNNRAHLHFPSYKFF